MNHLFGLIDFMVCHRGTEHIPPRQLLQHPCFAPRCQTALCPECAGGAEHLGAWACLQTPFIGPDDGHRSCVFRQGARQCCGRVGLGERRAGLQEELMNPPGLQSSSLDHRCIGWPDLLLKNHPCSFDQAVVIDAQHDFFNVVGETMSVLRYIPCCVETIVYHDYCAVSAENEAHSLAYCDNGCSVVSL